MASILVIDDDEAVSALFRQFLESAGYSVMLAANGQDGLEKMRANQPDLIITDIMMPEMDGLEIIRAVRTQHPELPIIAISGGMHAIPINFLPHAKKFGACRVFEKPVPLTALRTAVRELLNEPA